MIHVNEEQAGEIQKHKTGWKKRAGLMVLLLVAVIGGFIWLMMPPKEPTYQGKALSWWLSRFEDSGASIYDQKDPKAMECRDAVQHMGTNAIPNLLRILRAKDSAFKMAVVDLVERQDYIHVPFTSVEEQKRKAQLGFYLLGELASNAVPALVDIYTHPASEDSKAIADSTLTELYPVPCVAIPFWVRPEKRAQWYVKAGMAKLRSDATSNAILAFSQAIKLSPTNADVYRFRGETKFQLQDFTGAIMDIEKCMELSRSSFQLSRPGQGEPAEV